MMPLIRSPTASLRVAQVAENSRDRCLVRPALLAKCAERAPGDTAGREIVRAVKRRVADRIADGQDWNAGRGCFAGDFRIGAGFRVVLNQQIDLFD